MGINSTYFNSIRRYYNENSSSSEYSSDEVSEADSDDSVGSYHRKKWLAEPATYAPVVNTDDYKTCVEPRGGFVVNPKLSGLPFFDSFNKIDRNSRTCVEPWDNDENNNNNIKLTRVPDDDDIKFDVQITENDNEKECAVCIDNRPICIIAPCNHKIICVKCSIRLCKGKKKKTVNCPQCRTPIKAIGRVFE